AHPESPDVAGTFGIEIRIRARRRVRRGREVRRGRRVPSHRIRKHRLVEFVVDEFRLAELSRDHLVVLVVAEPPAERGMGARTPYLVLGLESALAQELGIL